MLQPYRLAATAHLCAADGGFIVLDAVRGSYLRIAGGEKDLLRELLDAATPDELRPDVADYAAKLLSLGLVCRDAAMARRHMPADPITPLLSLPPARVRSGLTDAMLTGGAHALAGHMMRHATFAQILAAAEKWKGKVPPGPAALADLHAKARVFEALSPLYHTRHDACFARSLAMLRYLTWRRAKADWVFGVRDHPFRAHCWIESGGFVLNDEAAHAEDYVRILTI